MSPGAGDGTPDCAAARPELAERWDGSDGATPDARASRPVSNWNPANAVTVLRLCLVPVFVAVLFHAGGRVPLWRGCASAVFAVATVTDRLDGELARRRGMVTDFGKIADPIADKALIGSALVGLSLLGQLAWWVTIVVLVREIAVTLLRFWVLRYGVIPASRGGKLKTLVQATAIGLYVLGGHGVLVAVRVAVMSVAVVVTVVTGVDYVLRAVRLRRASRSSGPEQLPGGGRSSGQ
jgi:CDP-diacylglycerol--glycerol-3-phosphate 3-phosphatidyltransferase